MEDTYSYKDVACRTLSRTPNLHGKFSLDDGFAWLHLVSFDERFEVNSSEPISVVLEDGSVVSLINKDAERPGYSVYYGRSVSHQVLLSNLSVCGARQWPNDARIKSISFEVTNSDAALYHPEALRIALDWALKIGARTSPLAKQETYRVECGDVTIEFFFGHEENSATWFDRHVHVRPLVTIEFREATVLSEGLDAAIAFVRFLAFSTATVIRPVRLNAQLWGARDDDHEARFSVFAKFPSGTGEREKPDFRDAVWSLSEDAERAMFFNSLRVWMDRRKSWRAPYELMEMALQHRPFLSGGPAGDCIQAYRSRSTIQEWERKRPEVECENRQADQAR